MKVHLKTERYILRDVELEDLQGMFALDSDPEVHKYLGNQPIQTLDQALKAIHYIRNQYEKNGIGRWAIEDKKTGDFIGWAGLKYEQEVLKDKDYYDIGYRLRKPYWGQGIATEVSIAALEYGFETLGLSEIGGGAEVDHVVSNHILTKIGLQFVETFYYDNILHHFYTLTKSQWTAKYKKQ